MKKSLLQKLIDIKNSKQPFSFIRFGDAEAMVLETINDPHAADFIMKKQLGQVLTQEDLESIRKQVASSFCVADLIGIADPWYETGTNDNKYWKDQKGQLKRNANVPDDKEYCSMNDHVFLAEDSEFYNYIKSFDKVVFITGRSFDESLLPNLKVIKIPAEQKYFAEEKGHYPTRFNEVHEWIDSQDLTGALVLVGGGFLGKTYVTHAAQKGAIALDIGSVFDTWAGYVTRGKNRGTTDDSKLLHKLI